MRWLAKFLMNSEYQTPPPHPDPHISLEDARIQINMLSFEELVFFNEAKVMFKVTQGIPSIYITEMFQIKRCTSEDTMTLRSDSNKKKLKHQSLN